MSRAVPVLALLLLGGSLAPAFAFSCDNPCKTGEVYSDVLELCVPAPKPVG
jgi:hypothetical protein